MRIEGRKRFFVAVLIILILGAIPSIITFAEGKSSFSKKMFKMDSNNSTLDEIQKNFDLGREEIKVIVEFNEKNIIGKTNSEVAKSIKIDKEKFGRDIGSNKKIMLISSEDYKKLKESKLIKKISIPREYKIDLQDSVPLINATSIWQKQISGINFTGKGQTICIIDTGVNYSHPDFGECYGNNSASSNCKIIGGWDFCSNSATCTNSEDWNPMDVEGHGTHVSGIAAANGSIKGVAPDAKIVMIKASNDTGSFWSSELKLGIDWCVNHASELNISVISMSLGGDLFEGYCDEYNDGDLTDQWDNVDLVSSINLAIFNGISIVVASGNGYTSNAISSPGCIQNVTPVSSTNKADTNISLFANTWNDSSLSIVVAPGENINSTIKTGNYEAWDGTSMATPHVAGAIAIIRQYLQLKSLTKTPQEIENILNSTGKQIYDVYSERYFSRIDVYSAVRSLCVDNITNTSWQNRGNISVCLVNNTQLSNWSITEYDANNCGFTNNVTYSLVNESFCDYCVPNLTNISIGWTNISCLATNLMNQTRNITQYDTNNCDEISNATFVEYRSTEFCDACLPNWNAVEEQNLVWFNDTNNCYAQTNLSSDLENKPLNWTFQIAENRTEIFDNDSNNSLSIELNFNFSLSQNSLTSINISKQNNVSNFSYMIIGGINLSENDSWVKTVYINKILNSTLFCVIDSENIGLGNFSRYCNSTAEEKFLKCPGNNGSYICSDNGTKFKISGLRNSGIKEMELFCGDGICNSSLSESCSSCSRDCGSCPTETSSPSSGGGGGGGGISTKTYSISEYNLSIGYNNRIAIGDKINFVISGNNHTIEAKKINKENISLQVKSETIDVNLKIGEEIKLNLTSKNYYDLQIKLENISSGKANLTIKKIFETRSEFASIDKGQEYHTMNETNESGDIIQSGLMNKTELKIVSTILAVIVLAIIYFLTRKTKNKKRKRK
jgi:hypothetical protein